MRRIVSRHFVIAAGLRVSALEFSILCRTVEEIEAWMRGEGGEVETAAVSKQ